MINELEKNNFEKQLSKFQNIMTIPDEYTLSRVIEGMQNGQPVLVFRYEREETGLGHEHFSFTIEPASNKLLGFTWFDRRFEKGASLPTKSQTKDIAEAFFEKAAPGLLQKIDHKWTAEHDELVLINEQEVLICGMKYKCYIPEHDSYAWVIVGPGGNVMTFEQEIIWRKGRVSEKWLHDSWLKHNLKENLL